MALKTFVWIPSQNGLREMSEPKVRKAQFGDGYAQVAPDGINHNPLKFDLSFGNRKSTETDNILSFLRARGGYEEFVWTPPAPYDVTALFRCEKWDHVEKEYNNYDITASFQQVFMPWPTGMLLSLVMQWGDLVPDFEPGIFDYTVDVANDITSMTVTPTVINGVTVQVNGLAVASGSPSIPTGLLVGDNVFTIVVTDGITSTTYIVTVTRAA